MFVRDQTLLEVTSRQTWISLYVCKFGHDHGVPHLAEVVLDLYDAALMLSSRKTYNTGQRAYRQFINTLRSGEMLPFNRRHLAKTELTLAYFMASLLLKPTINVGTTILGYESHVKY